MKKMINIDSPAYDEFRAVLESLSLTKTVTLLELMEKIQDAPKSERAQLFEVVDMLARIKTQARNELGVSESKDLVRMVDGMKDNLIALIQTLKNN